MGSERRPHLPGRVRNAGEQCQGIDVREKNLRAVTRRVSQSTFCRECLNGSATVAERIEQLRVIKFIHLGMMERGRGSELT